MPYSNLIDQITIGSLTIATVDSDPSVNSYVASLGSFAQFTDNTNKVFFYEKTGTADNAWTIVDLGLINLATQVLGILPIANGGTNLGTTPTNGQVLIGNGTGYTLSTLTAGSNISIVNGVGTVTVSSSLDSTLHTDTVTTTDNTITTLSTIATTTDSTAVLECTILGRRTGGSGAGNVGDSSTSIHTYTVKNTAGVVTVSQTQTDYLFVEGGLGGVKSPLVSGTNVLIQVQGKANATVDWKNSDMFTKVI